MHDKVVEDGIPKYFPTHVSAPKENQDTQTPLKSQDSKQIKSSRTQLETITNKAAGLSISVTADSAKQAPRPPTHSRRLQAEEEEQQQLRRSPRIRAKRVRSTLDDVSQ